MEIKKVGVVGCGLMGSGIAQIAAQAGFDVVVREVEQSYLDKGFGRIRGVTDLKDLADRDIVIEAVTENLKVKEEVFSTLDACLADHAILASNTSSLSIVEMAAFTKRPDRFIGLHFFNPVPIMKLVEVVRTVTSSKESVDTGMAFAESLGKKPILAKDSPGFVVNLLLVPFLLSAIRAVEKGIASIPDIDKGMILGCGHPMGPLTLLDFVGLDTTYYIADIMFDEFKTAEYAAPTLLKRMVMAGYHGRKSGKGFYDYSGEKPVPTEGLV